MKVPIWAMKESILDFMLVTSVSNGSMRVGANRGFLAGTNDLDLAVVAGGGRFLTGFLIGVRGFSIGGREGTTDCQTGCQTGPQAGLTLLPVD